MYVIIIPIRMSNRYYYFLHMIDLIFKILYHITLIKLTKSQVYGGINLATGQRLAVKEVVLQTGKKYKAQLKALEVKLD